MAKLKVYGWLGGLPSGFKLPEHKSHRAHARCIVAATSKAEVARIAGYRGPWVMHNLSETGNATEIEVAMAKPGTVFFQDEFNHTPREKVYVELVDEKPTVY